VRKLIAGASDSERILTVPLAILTQYMMGQTDRCTSWDSVFNAILRRNGTWK